MHLPMLTGTHAAETAEEEQTGTNRRETRGHKRTCIRYAVGSLPLQVLDAASQKAPMIVQMRMKRLKNPVTMRRIQLTSLITLASLSDASPC